VLAVPAGRRLADACRLFSDERWLPRRSGQLLAMGLMLKTVCFWL
jgi:hypothetical protein